MHLNTAWRLWIAPEQSLRHNAGPVTVLPGSDGQIKILPKWKLLSQMITYILVKVLKHLCKNTSVIKLLDPTWYPIQRERCQPDVSQFFGRPWWSLCAVNGANIPSNTNHSSCHKNSNTGLRFDHRWRILIHLCRSHNYYYQGTAVCPVEPWRHAQHRWDKPHAEFKWIYGKKNLLNPLCYSSSLLLGDLVQLDWRHHILLCCTPEKREDSQVMTIIHHYFII